VLLISCLLGTIAFVIGCNRQAQANSAPPPPAVTVAKPIEREVIEWDEYTGRLASVDMVDVRPQVSGKLMSAPFQEGAFVEKGTLLFTIDVRPFQAELDARIAAMHQAEAQVALTKVEFERNAAAVKTAAVSQSDYDRAKANYDSAVAQLAGAKAAVDAAALNVEYCQVKTDVEGRVANRIVTPGNLVTANTTLLTTVVPLDPAYCYFDADEGHVLKYQELARLKKRVSARDARIPCFMALSNETDFPHEGVVDFVDNRLDPNTGTLRARGVFPNPGRYMTPGMYARMRIPGSGRYNAILVPDAAIGTNQNERYLLVLGPEDKVQYRPVKLGAQFDQLRAIEEGIGPEDRVIINGLQLARPGSMVKPIETTLQASGMTLRLTAPGSPTTQELPATRRLSTTGLGLSADAAAAELNTISRAATQPTSKPSSQPSSPSTTPASTTPGNAP
jgi:RND family efflux transporter MFP subunit